MSAMNFQSTFRDNKPPDKGSFPLDHEGLCKNVMIKYMRCLRENCNDNTVCRQFSKDYLQCRMENDLMKKEDFAKLGYKDLTDQPQLTTNS